MGAIGGGSIAHARDPPCDSNHGGAGRRASLPDGRGNFRVVHFPRRQGHFPSLRAVQQRARCSRPAAPAHTPPKLRRFSPRVPDHGHEPCYQGRHAAAPIRMARRTQRALETGGRRWRGAWSSLSSARTAENPRRSRSPSCPPSSRLAGGAVAAASGTIDRSSERSAPGAAIGTELREPPAYTRARSMRLS